jgi:hypothetical protein
MAMSRAEFARAVAAKMRRLERTHSIEYLDLLPAEIPRGKRLVHYAKGQPRPLQAWLEVADDDRHRGRVACDCGFAPELGLHYRVVWQTETP